MSSTMEHYDAIVLGTGGVGSAALWHLARRGIKVLGLDRFAPPHDRGSSHGQSRIIRQAYFEHPDYTPLLLKTYPLWNELSERASRRLYHEVGVLQMGPAEGEVVAGVLRAAKTHGLDIERLMASEVERRWPALRVPETLVGVLEARAGYLMVEECIDAHLRVARDAGADMRECVEVHDWQPGPPVTLQTSGGAFAADRLIVTAGAWSGPMLKELNVDLEIRRKSLFWFPSDADQAVSHETLPCFLYELPSGVFYGMPKIDQRGVKIAEHSGGQRVEDPLNVDRDVDPDDYQRAREFVGKHLPSLSSKHSRHCTCLYTMSPDEHFIVDRHPEHPQVVFAAGLSGHGFKFAPILGEALTELALDGKTDLPIEFLALR